MKKLLAIALAALMALLPVMSLAEGELTMGSWRTDDTEQVNALLAKYEELTGIHIDWTSIPSSARNEKMTLAISWVVAVARS